MKKLTRSDIEEIQDVFIKYPMEAYIVVAGNVKGVALRGFMLAELCRLAIIGAATEESNT